MSTTIDFSRDSLATDRVLETGKKNSALDITRDIPTDERPGCKVALKRTRTVEISDWVMGWPAAKNFGQIEHYLIDAGIDHAS